MTVTTYQIRNVLRIYGNQLKRRSNLVESHSVGARTSADFVEISVEARRKQAVDKLSSDLISQLTPEDDSLGSIKEEIVKDNILK